MLCKWKLKNCRNVKPFWANKTMLTDEMYNINKFFREVISTRHSLSNLRGYSFLGPSIFWDDAKYVPIEDRVKVGMREMPRFRMVKSYRYLKDPSGINQISKEKLERLIIEKICGIYCHNSIVNLKVAYNCDVRLCIDSSEVEVSEFLWSLYSKYIGTINDLMTLKKMYKHVCNSVFGALGSVYSQVICRYGGFDLLESNSIVGTFMINYINHNSMVEYTVEHSLTLYDDINLEDIIKNDLKVANLSLQSTTISINLLK